GCVETVISGPALERYYEGLTSQKLSLEEIVEKSTQNEKAALLTLDRLYRYFGQAISNVINILDPDLIVLGGGVSNIIDLPRSGLEYARKWVFTDSLQTRIVSNTLGDSAGVYGAAMLVK
ncbi:MAG: ROK family protein, partial [Bdellovibrionales bacterium]|nr:ROK family protein [Bdellovibrionales bacterium]